MSLDALELLFYFFPKRALPKRIAPRKRTRKIKNKILAIDAAPAAIPVNPNIPAMIAITRKIAAHFSIVVSFNNGIYKNDAIMLCKMQRLEKNYESGCLSLL